MRRVVWLYSLVLFVACSSAGLSQEEEPPKRLGKNKKKVNGTLYASYGLSPRGGDPQKVVHFSKAAVAAASTGAVKSAGTKAQRASQSRKAQQQQQQHKGEPPAPGTQPKVDLRPYMSAVENQADSNSCAANAVAGAYEYLATRAALRDGEKSVGEISRLFIYYVGRKRDQLNWGESLKTKPRDEGMTLQGGIEAVQLKGAALQSSWPFHLDRVNDRPPEDAFDEAMHFKVGDAMKIPVDLDKMRQCLSEGYPIIFGLKLTEAFFYPPYDGFIPTPDPTDPQSAAHGLHAMLIVGYNDRQRVFIIRNSWGTGWGVDGYCFLSYDYVVNPEFNFVGQYAIQSLTDDDLTPDDDDGHDIAKHADPSNNTPYVELEHVVDDGIIVEEDEEHDAENMFDTKEEARRAFLKFAGDPTSMASHNLQLSKDELKAALTTMGFPMVTTEEIDMAFALYDDDKSGYINFEEFLDMQHLFDGSLLKRRRWINKVKNGIRRFFKNLSSKTPTDASTEQSPGGEL